MFPSAAERCVPRPTANRATPCQLCVLGDDGTSTTAVLCSQQSTAPHGALCTEPSAQSPQQQPHGQSCWALLAEPFGSSPRRAAWSSAQHIPSPATESCRGQTNTFWNIWNLSGAPHLCVSSLLSLLPSLPCSPSWHVWLEHYEEPSMFLHCHCCILVFAARGDLKSLKEAVIKMTKRCKAV